MDEQVKNDESVKEHRPANESAPEPDCQREQVADLEQWQTALETAVKQRDEYLDMARRAQADFQNFKRRNAQTRTDAYDEGVRDTLTAILPVIDNLDRAVAAGAENADARALLEGVELTRRILSEAVQRMGLVEIKAVGEDFDPNKHNAVMRCEEGEPGKVLEEFEKGYEARGRVLRYSTVKVSVEAD
ncbi:MAG: nucleotide exchange factor GrpE [Clostridia bacterium]|nr:nucleotide exchange factor GrpE [Clostridia bacterium]